MRRALFGALVAISLATMFSGADAIGLNSLTTGTRVRWPRDACPEQHGHRITTTTTADADGFIAEPARGRASEPRLTEQQAYANFVRLYGRQQTAERRATQVRYGVITSAANQIESTNALQGEPMARRVPGWLITNCAAPTRPRGIERHPGHPGQLIFALADRPRPFALGWTYAYKALDGYTYSTSGSSISGGPRNALPPLGSTRYYSVPWALVRRSANGLQALLRYKQLRCYALDHVNVNEDVYSNHGAVVTVILSTGPRGTCARPSAIAPYMAVIALNEPFGLIHHGSTGSLRFKAQSSGGTGIGTGP